MTTPDLPTRTDGSAPGPAGDAPVLGATGWDRVRAWRPSRGGLALAALLLVALTLLMLTSTPRTGYLDPLAVDPGGSRAVANVLGDQGVLVRDVRTAAAAAGGAGGATVLITDTTLVTEAMLDRLLAAGPARVVLVEPPAGPPALQRLAAGIEPADTAGDDPVQPGCGLAVAQRAGAAQLPGVRFDTTNAQSSVSACYDRPDSAGVVVVPAGDGRPEVVLLGAGHPLTNDGFAAQGNAALVLGLLGGYPEVVWWRPSLADPALAGQAGTPIGELLPGWVWPVLVQVLVACGLLVWWRGRRLGPLVVEPLPVVVRAAETTAGHGRLLHANHARGEAASHLRARARERIRTRLALPLGIGEQRLCEAAAHRAERSPQRVEALLYGPEPTTDHDLVVLGHELDTLIVEVGGA